MNSRVTLEAKGLSKSFGGVKAIDDLDITFYDGKVLGLVGPNGSGKTTLVNLLTGIHQMDSGEVKIGETIFKKILPEKISFYGITRTFQKVRLIEQMSVLENLLMVLSKKDVISALFEKNQKYNEDKAVAILERLDIIEKKDEMVENLSYGQRKLLEIGRTLATESEVYFFDEPFAGLSPKMNEIVSGVILDLKADRKTVILIEHDMKLIKNLSDEIFVMAEGKELRKGDPEEILKDPEVIRVYLG